MGGSSEGVIVTITEVVFLAPFVSSGKRGGGGNKRRVSTFTPALLLRIDLSAERVTWAGPSC